MKKSALLALLLCQSAHAEEADRRQILCLTGPQREYVLNEMRSLLNGTQQILGALAKDDMKSVAESARALGLTMKHKAENPLHEVLPKAFMMLGMSMHKDFDAIAADAETLKDPKHTLKQLDETMGKCNACHASYQIRSASAGSVSDSVNARLDEVARRGRQAMPFDLEQTTHIFSKTPNGGIQQVVAKDNTNAGQIDAIRQHLSKIAKEFKHGNFSTPAKIHGDDMPGLNEMRNAKPGLILIDYHELPEGAEIAFSSQEPTLIDAVHRYFDAQLSDHARHAHAGHRTPDAYAN